AQGRTLQTQLLGALQAAFSDASASEPGFEWLRAELLVMMGDDAYVKALSSRFDLAELGIADFRGTALEPGGINLSGVAGAEMSTFYLATQYYGRATERLSALLGPMGQIVEKGDQVIGRGAAVEFARRVIRASSQKTGVASEIARHYQSFDRTDLARQ